MENQDNGCGCECDCGSSNNCGGCGGGCSSCGGEGYCGIATNEKAPGCYLAFDRAKLMRIVDKMIMQSPAAEFNLILDDPRGLVLKFESDEVIAERIDSELTEDGTNEFDPVDNWSYDTAKKSSSAGLVDPFADIKGYVANLAEGLNYSKPPLPAFFALTVVAPMLYSLRPVAYWRVKDADHYRKIMEFCAADVKEPTELQLSCGFIVDGLSHACEEFRKRPFLRSGKKPEVGQSVIIRAALKGTALASCTLTGEIVEIMSVNPDVPQGLNSGTMCCAEPPSKEQIVKEMGAANGQQIRAVLYLTQEYVGRVEELEGQWEAILEANINTRVMWHIKGNLKRLPIEKWVSVKL